MSRAENEFVVFSSWVLLVLIHLIIGVDNLLFHGTCGVESHWTVSIIAFNHQNWLNLSGGAKVALAALEISIVRIYIDCVPQMSVIEDWGNPVNAENMGKSVPSSVSNHSLSAVTECAFDIEW